MLIILTGASGGIGFELLKKCSQNEGNLVLAVSRHTSALEKWVKQEQRYNVLVMKLDITREAHLDKLSATLRKLNLNVDILINNAGELLNKPFSEISAAELERVYKANVFAPFLLIQKMLPFMNKALHPHVVNISSMGGVQGTQKFDGLSAYSSSKGALALLSECLAQELKAYRVAVNCLAIGAVQTDMLKKAFPGYKAPVTASQMAQYIYDFAKQGHHYYNGKILPVALSTP